MITHTHWYRRPSVLIWYFLVQVAFMEPNLAQVPQSASTPTSVIPSSDDSEALRPPRGKISDRFPNILLHTHDNKPVRFYDDLVKDKKVIVNFIYTTCQESCIPTTAKLALVHKHLGDHVGRDLLMLSISLDPAIDTPKVLKEYVSRFGEFPGWYFLTGDYDDIEQLRYKMGVYDLDPVIDADKTQHAGIITFGNDRTDRWAALPALMDPRGIVQTVLRITRDPKHY